MATNDNIYDLAEKLEEDDIEFLLITVQKGKQDHQSTALFNIKTVDGCDVIYTTFDEVYEGIARGILEDDRPREENEEDEES
jgi:hypothetical protein